MTIYKAVCSNIYEGGAFTISLHKTIDGANKSIIDNILTEYLEFIDIFDLKYGEVKSESDVEFAWDLCWSIQESELLD